MMEGEIFIIQLLGFAFCVGFLGLFIGGINERRHFKDLDAREKKLAHIRVCNLKQVHDAATVGDARMLLGNVVIATDYFKSFATGLRNLVGGEMKAAIKLMQRARREALLRVLEEADGIGATELWNVRFAFSNVSQMQGRRGAMQVEILAWGTAITRG